MRAVAELPAVAPVDAADEAAMDALTMRDIYGYARPHEAAWLRAPEQLSAWRAALIRAKLATEKELAKIRDEAAQRQTECFAEGYKGKARWFKLRTRLDEQRAPLVRVFEAIEARIRECAPAIKALREEQRAALPFDDAEIAFDQLKHAFVRLDKAEARVSSLRTQVSGLRKSVLQLLRVLTSGNRLDEATARAIRDHVFPAPVALAEAANAVVVAHARYRNQCKTPRGADPVPLRVAVAKLQDALSALPGGEK